MFAPTTKTPEFKYIAAEFKGAYMHANVHNVHDPEARVDLPRASEDEYGRRLLSNRIPALGEPSATPVVYSVDYRGPQVHLGHNRCPRLSNPLPDGRALLKAMGGG